MIASINPVNGEIVRTFEAATEAEVEAALTRADAAWHSYRRTSFAARGGWLTAAASILENEQDRLGRLMTLEMGKPIAAARAEAAKCALDRKVLAELAAGDPASFTLLVEKAKAALEPAV